MATIDRSHRKPAGMPVELWAAKVFEGITRYLADHLTSDKLILCVNGVKADPMALFELAASHSTEPFDLLADLTPDERARFVSSVTACAAVWDGTPIRVDVVPLGALLPGAPTPN